MAKGSPSMIALLGLLAVAGYQNRDKLGALMNARPALPDDPDRNLAGMNGPSNRPSNGQPDGPGGLIDSFRKMAGGASGGGLMGGLSEIFDRLSVPQHQAKAQSWVSTGRNESLAPDELEQALDDETIAELVEKTGLSRSELLSRLSQTLPEAVDQASPDGHFPPLSMPEPRSI